MSKHQQTPGTHHAFRRRFTLTVALLTAVLVGAVAGAAQAADAAPPHFQALQTKLIRDGFDRNVIEKLYKSHSVQFDMKSVSLYFVYQESKLNYDQFLSRSSIMNARKYMKTHREALLRAEQRYRVDAEIITAIILVETRLGTFWGNRSVFNTLSSIAALSEPAVRNALWQNIAGSSRYSRTRFNEKAIQKARWAYNEIRAFLRYAAAENLNPLAVNGSFAGAMGIPQFMPSNALTLARDGNDDGRVNLFDHADAIMSVAHYLKYHGWRPGLNHESAGKVIYAYNHSSYYVDTILKAAALLKG